MAEKIISTRIKLLNKSYEQWQEIKDTFIPLQGEACICVIPASTGAVANEPAVLIKIGDGEKTYAQLNYVSALAADVYGWAKKASLEFGDLSAQFINALDSHISGQVQDTNTTYRLNKLSDFKYQLQSKEKGSSEWVDVQGSLINIPEFDPAAIISRISALESGKVDKEILSDGGKARIFNEADGGGAKFENVDGTASFAGVNNDTNGGIGAQLYDIDVESNTGSKLDVTIDGIYYTSGLDSAKAPSLRDVEANELATKKDIAAIVVPEYSLRKESDPGDYAAIYHLTKDGVDVGESINIAKDQLLKSVEVKTCTQKDTPITGLDVGDKYLDFTFIVESGSEAHTYIAIKDMVKPYTAGEGIVITSENAITVDTEVIATVDYVDANISDTMNYVMQEDAAERAARIAGDNLKVDKKIEGANGEAYIFNESDGGGARFVNNDGSEAFVGVNDGGKDGLMAQIYADVLKNGAWSGSRINVYNNKIYYTNQADVDNGVQKNAADHEIAIKRDLETKIDETDVLILDCNL